MQLHARIVDEKRLWTIELSETEMFFSIVKPMLRSLSLDVGRSEREVYTTFAQSPDKILWLLKEAIKKGSYKAEQYQLLIAFLEVYVNTSISLHKKDNDEVTSYIMKSFTNMVIQKMMNRDEPPSETTIQE